MTIGWYGKLPSLGDFASRRLPPSFINDWDDWLQQGMAASRDTWGALWIERYLVAPILRFWLAPGVLGDYAWAGVLMPSVDRVGRHFPLTLAQPAGALAQTFAARDWFETLDSAARRVLDVDYTVDDFEFALEELECADGHPSDHDERLANAMLLDRPQRSAWWCDDGGPRGYDALPPAGELAVLWGSR
jgi:type VI secretion system protein ImpM